MPQDTIICFSLFTLDVLCLTGKLGTVSSSMMLDPSGPGKGRGTLAGKGSKRKHSN